MITLTENAIKKVKTYLAEDQSLSGKNLRVYVQEGGCSGMEYGFGFDEQKADDTVVKMDGLEVLIDPKSVPLLEGSTVDYVETLEGEGFSVTNPHSTGGCGCGHSFSV